MKALLADYNALKQVPFIITEDLRLFYYRGIQNWGQTNGSLRDTCLTAQDHYKVLLDYFKVLKCFSA